MNDDGEPRKRRPLTWLDNLPLMIGLRHRRVPVSLGWFIGEVSQMDDGVITRAMRLPKIGHDTGPVLCLKYLMGRASPLCPHCGQPTTSLFNARKTTYICSKCDEDPMKSPKVRKLIRAMKPPKDEPQEPIPDRPSEPSTLLALESIVQ
jgi:hypothetical protein